MNANCSVNIIFQTNAKFNVMSKFAIRNELRSIAIFGTFHIVRTIRLQKHFTTFRLTECSISGIIWLISCKHNYPFRMEVIADAR